MWLVAQECFQWSTTLEKPCANVIYFASLPVISLTDVMKTEGSFLKEWCAVACAPFQDDVLRKQTYTRTPGACAIKQVQHIQGIFRLSGLTDAKKGDLTKPSYSVTRFSNCGSTHVPQGELAAVEQSIFWHTSHTSTGHDCWTWKKESWLADRHHCHIMKAWVEKWI